MLYQLEFGTLPRAHGGQGVTMCLEGWRLRSAMLKARPRIDNRVYLECDPAAVSEAQRACKEIEKTDRNFQIKRIAYLAHLRSCQQCNHYVRNGAPAPEPAEEQA